MRLLLSFLKIGETFAFFQFVNWAPSLELTFITAVMEGAKASAHSLRTNVGRLSGREPYSRPASLVSLNFLNRDLNVTQGTANCKQSAGLF